MTPKEAFEGLSAVMKVDEMWRWSDSITRIAIGNNIIALTDSELTEPIEWGEERSYRRYRPQKWRAVRPSDVNPRTDVLVQYGSEPGNNRAMHRLVGWDHGGPVICCNGQYISAQSQHVHIQESDND
jgi:hypothetical protein